MANLPSIPAERWLWCQRKPAPTSRVDNPQRPGRTLGIQQLYADQGGV